MHATACEARPSIQRHMTIASVHAVDDFVDQFFAVAPDASLVEWVSLLLPAVSRSVKLEWPEEVVGLLEVRADGPNLVDQILNAVDAVFLAEGASDNAVVGQRDS